MKLWKFLTTDISELKLKQAEDITKARTDTAKAVFDLAKAVNEQGGKVDVLKEYVGQISSLLDVLNSPIAQIIKNTIPFAPLEIGILKLIAETTKQEPTLEQCIALVSQTAYLESLQSLLPEYAEELGQKEQVKASGQVIHQLKQLGEQEFTNQEAKDALLQFPTSKLAQEFNKILQVRLQEAGLSEQQAATLTARTAWKTHYFINEALAKHADTLKPLAELYRNGGREVLERYQSIETYLEEQIKPRPKEKVFAESFTFEEIYVPLKAQFLKNDGTPDKNKDPVKLEEWAGAWLDDDQHRDQVMFIQGGPGRGKSVFCRMFSDWVRQHEYPRWIPILIRLRDVRTLEKDFEETLRKAVDRDFAKNDAGWLTDRNIRFLFVLDGFDELLMEGRTSGGLEEFLKQIGRFQESCKENSEKGHRILVTGRTLSLQTIERYMPSNLKRVELLPMDQKLQTMWFDKWSSLAGTQTAIDFQKFLQDPRCPKRIRGSVTESGLAQEPLLLYLLAAMHRDNELTLEMFDGSDGTKAKVLIYERSLDWVLTKQRPDWLNRNLTELETDSLRRVLAEAGLCVVQTGGECAPIVMIEERLKGDEGVKTLLENARTRLQDNPLRNALAAFYLQPGRSHEGSVEFAHKSFGEFLCADRLKEAIEDWTRPGIRRQEFYIPTEKLYWEIYDLLGQPVLTQEIAEYLKLLLENSPDFQPVVLFKRLHEFYDRWCNGEFINATPAENLPQKKLMQLQSLSISTGLCQVDVYTGLNVLILLLELHRYAQTKEELENRIVFYPSGQIPKGSGVFTPIDQLLKIIHYSDSIAVATFTHIVGVFLTSATLAGTNLAGADLDSANLDRANLAGTNLAGANLNSATLYGANLHRANLHSANFHSATLYGANLHRANLHSANLTGADLTGADLREADLSNANLTSADLDNIIWNQNTKWNGVIGLATARNVPPSIAPPSL